MWPGEDCDFCRGGSAPPEFSLPPPPLPPFLTSQMDESVANIFCNDISLHDTEMCNSLLMLDNMHHSSLAFRVSNIIVVCTAFFVVTGLLGILAIVKCRQRILKKMNSSKGDISSHYHECFSSINASANQALYEDITEVSFSKNHNKLVEPLSSHMKMTPYKKQTLQTIAVHYPRNSRNQQVKICATSSGPYAYNSQNIYGETPIYEELPGNQDTDLDSENEDGFAEDESSLVDDTLTTALPIHNDIELLPYKHQYNVQNKQSCPDRSNIQTGWKHGLLISGHQDVPQYNTQYYQEYCCKCSSRYMVPKVNYDAEKVMLPIVKPLRSHRNPQSIHPQSIHLQNIHPQGFCATSTSEGLHQDSSFGSDSGYSNHTHVSYSRTGKVILSSSAFEH